jgi:hypothetical protein
VRKKLTVLVLVGLALVLVSGPALAAGSGRDTYVAKQGPKRKPHVISLTGTMEGLATRSVSVRVQMTNYPYLYLRGKTLTLATTPTTVYYVWSDNGKTRSRVTLSELMSFVATKTAVRVSINAREDPDGVFTARRVEVNKPRYR